MHGSVCRCSPSSSFALLWGARPNLPARMLMHRRGTRKMGFTHPNNRFVQAKGPLNSHSPPHETESRCCLTQGMHKPTILQTKYGPQQQHMDLPGPHKRLTMERNTCTMLRLLLLVLLLLLLRRTGLPRVLTCPLSCAACSCQQLAKIRAGGSGSPKCPTQTFGSFLLSKALAVTTMQHTWGRPYQHKLIIQT